MKLKCDYTKAKELIGWEPQYTLDEGIKETEEWIKKRI
jgi:nucleoside-diphosphate-sugar epimerase